MMKLNEYRDFLLFDDLSDDLELLEEIIEDECPEQSGDEWVIETA